MAKNVKIKTAPDDLDELRSVLQMAEFGQTGGPDSSSKAFRAWLDQLSEMGVSDQVITKLKLRGPTVLQKGKMPKGVSALLGGKSGPAKEALKIAQAAAKGIHKEDLQKAIERTLITLQRTGAVDEASVAEMRQALKKVGPDVFNRMSPSQALAGLAERQEPGFVSSIFRRVAGRKTSGGGKPSPEALSKLAEESGGAVPAATPATQKILGKGGVKLGPKSMFKGPLGAVNALGIGYTAYQMYDELIRKPGIRRDPLNAPGYLEHIQEQMTATGIRPRPIDYLRHEQETRDRLAQRKAVLFTQEPTLSQQLIATLAGKRQDDTPLTRTEMSIGSVPQRQSVQPRKQDVQTMLDQLLSELD